MTKRAVLAIHGFSGHPEEMRFLGTKIADRLQARLYLPTLLGHATKPEDLLSTMAEDWYRQVEATYDRLRKRHQEVIVLGNSFGANLALKLARHRPVRAVVALSIPYVRWYQRWQLKILIAINKPFRQFWTKPRKGPRATEQIPGYQQRCYERIPLRAMEELLRFEMNEMQTCQLGAVQSPTLLVVPRGDPFVPAEAANVYRGRLGSQTKDILLWDDPYHLIVQGQRKEALATTIIDWLENQLGFVFEPKSGNSESNTNI
ncbi:MAG: alpha/beta fold hydrolase [Patescibacteria group bacterium]